MSWLERFTKAHLPPTRFTRFEFEEEKCLHCKSCVQTCPTSCLVWDEDRNIPKATGLKGMTLACIGCNNCEAVCPAGCIRMRGEYRVLAGRYKTPEDRKGEMTLPKPIANAEDKEFSKIEEQLTPTERLIYKRRSIRLYKDRPVPEDLIWRVLEAGRFAPSAGNGQPLKAIVCCNKEINKQVDQKCAQVLTRINNLYLSTNPFSRLAVKILSLLMVNKWDQRPIAAMEKVKQTGSITFGAPVVIHLLKDRRGISHPDVDVAIAAQNMVLTAHSLGLGTCYVGFIASTMDYAPGVKKLLGITYPYRLVLSLCLGFPKIKMDQPVPRLPLPVSWLD